MSRDNVDYDVRIAIYDGSKHPLCNIKFYNDCEMLLDGERFSLERDGDRLYIVPDPSGVKFSCKTKDTLQIWKDFSKTRDLEGTYDLKYDGAKARYFIDKSQKISDHEHKSILKGTKQLNHNSGEREKRPAVVITDKGKRMVETMNKQESKENKTVVVKALLSLLKSQVKDNKEALNTVDALEKFI